VIHLPPPSDSGRLALVVVSTFRCPGRCALYPPSPVRRHKTNAPRTFGKRPCRPARRHAARKGEGRVRPMSPRQERSNRWPLSFVSPVGTASTRTAWSSVPAIASTRMRSNSTFIRNNASIAGRAPPSALSRRSSPRRRYPVRGYRLFSSTPSAHRL
jgi:hypothetical protein